MITETKEKTVLLNYFPCVFNINSLKKTLHSGLFLHIYQLF